ncbi:MAG TPA: EAL domain-containing protein, partial [Nevskiaceae bacterium]|nr:EAL domain-containing protein [Nevskiaceae bacterium]
MSEVEAISWERIHGALSAALQPIVDLQTDSVHGYEACMRGPEGAHHLPAALLSLAQRDGCLLQLEQSACAAAMRAFVRQQLGGALFINVSPASLIEPALQQGLLRCASEIGLAAPRLVIELTEQQMFEDYARLRGAILACRNLGFRVALDDLGAGYAGLRAWSELQPDYVKVDRYFVDQIDRDAAKRGFFGSILE